jgi:hypothetical protein
MLETEFRPPDPDAMRHLTDGLATKSAKIRALGAAGYRRADIANFLGIRYQHVRNVLESPAPRGAKTGLASAYTAGQGRLEEDGHVLLPPEALARLLVSPGRVIPWRAGEDGEVILMSADAGIRYAQAIVAKHRKPGQRSMVDELIEERRAEAARESERDGR